MFIKCDCYQRGVASPCPHQRVRTLLKLMLAEYEWDEEWFHQSGDRLKKYLGWTEADSLLYLPRYLVEREVRESAARLSQEMGMSQKYQERKEL